MDSYQKMLLIQQRIATLPNVWALQLKFGNLSHRYEKAKFGWRLVNAMPCSPHMIDVLIVAHDGSTIFFGSWEEFIRWK